MEISGQNLIFAYVHDIEGSWRYTFRYQDYAFELIGYDSSVGSLEYTNTEYNINFLTKKIKMTTYKERESQSEEPPYDPEIQWKDIEVNDPYQLSADERGIDGLSEYVHNLIDAATNK